MCAENDRREASSALVAADWLAACRRMVEQQRDVFAAAPSIAERTVYEGIGEGGDRALAIDRRCEDIVFRELDAMHADGNAFTAISEERGEVGFDAAGSEVRVIIDPIDGSLNARRTIPSHCLSIAVAGGGSMADVEFGYVYDFGASEEFVATRGDGAQLNGRPIRAEGPGHGIEVVGLESAEPGWILPAVEGLRGKAFRVRSIGAIAITLAYVAVGRLDGMLTARVCRSVDAAGGQLIAREAGARVEFEDLELARTSLGLDARYRLAAGLDSDVLAVMLEAQGPAG
ncbi:MAG TPA: inositol monophosphatase family protein [Solirubrobacterales bacterium]|nr:inositol monophosphatase family protein [Solirubrobacterales bacterium]